MPTPDFIESSATFSDCERYRFTLTRVWDRNLPRVCFVMLNPSTADAEKLDPTVTRCVNYAKEWGYGSLIVVNCSAFRATDPKEMLEHKCSLETLVSNTRAISDSILDSDLCVGAWGNDAPMEFLKWMVDTFPFFRSLAINKSGHPVHPLYQKADLPPTPYIELLNAKKNLKDLH